MGSGAEAGIADIAAGREVRRRALEHEGLPFEEVAQRGGGKPRSTILKHEIDGLPRLGQRAR
jgi:hypothetical protein